MVATERNAIDTGFAPWERQKRLPLRVVDEPKATFSPRPCRKGAQAQRKRCCAFGSGPAAA